MMMRFWVYIRGKRRIPVVTLLIWTMNEGLITVLQMCVGIFRYTHCPVLHWQAELTEFLHGRVHLLRMPCKVLLKNQERFHIGYTVNSSLIMHRLHVLKNLTSFLNFGILHVRLGNCQIQNTTLPVSNRSRLYVY